MNTIPIVVWFFIQAASIILYLWPITILLLAFISFSFWFTHKRKLLNLGTPVTARKSASKDIFYCIVVLLFLFFISSILFIITYLLFDLIKSAIDDKLVSMIESDPIQGYFQWKFEFWKRAIIINWIIIVAISIFWIALLWGWLRFFKALPKYIFIKKPAEQDAAANP